MIYFWITRERLLNWMPEANTLIMGNIKKKNNIKKWNKIYKSITIKRKEKPFLRALKRFPGLESRMGFPSRQRLWTNKMDLENLSQGNDVTILVRPKLQSASKQRKKRYWNTLNNHAPKALKSNSVSWLRGTWIL